MKLLEEFDIENMIKQKAQTLYQNVCVELIETNNLKEKALGICESLLDKLIQDEKGKDSLLSYEGTLEDIKREIRSCK